MYASEQGILNAQWNAALEAQNSAVESRKPHVLMRPRVSIDGNQWCALYGENLQDGIAGFGDSPAKAMEDFNKNWDTSLAHPRGR